VKTKNRRGGDRPTSGRDIILARGWEGKKEGTFTKKGMTEGGGGGQPEMAVEEAADTL